MSWLLGVIASLGFYIAGVITVPVVAVWLVKRWLKG
jgi:hypothetical protein